MRKNQATLLPRDLSVNVMIDFTRARFLTVAVLLSIMPTAWAQSYSTSIVMVNRDGGRVDWQQASGNLIACDQLTNGRYEIYVMSPDGKNKRCISCSNAAIVGGSRGNPAWHPGGKFIAVQVEKPGHKTMPGFGQWSDLWLIGLDGSSALPLTDLPVGPDYGVLHPHFSADGRKLAWSEMYKKGELLKKGEEYGLWHLCVADFTIGPSGPRLSNVQKFEPMGPAFYENHGFSPDGTTLFFSSNAHTQKPLFLDSDIYSFNLNTGRVARLTTDGYNEHAEISPDGTKIVWMTTNENANKGTDLWMMNPDGTNKQRLTHFNQPNYPEFTGQKLVAADSSWSPDGKSLILYVQDSLLKQTGSIYLVKLQEKAKDLH